jgi:glycosyltransferase involved in cell wall biosynthesis
MFNRIVIIPSDYPVNKLTFKSLGIENIDKSRLIVFRLPIGVRLNNYIFRIFDLIFGLKWRALILFVAITIYRPTIVHFQELQHGGYIYNSKIFKSRFKRKYKVICSTWGSDLILYGKLSSHELALEKLLSNTDILTAERVEDEEIARKLNFSKQFLAPVYITVGTNIESRFFSSKPSERKTILVKGYQDNHGRALNALAALTLIKEHLSGYKIRVFSASIPVNLQVEYLNDNNLLDIEIIKRSSNDEIKKYFSQSRVYIGLAISDGLSTSMVEAIEQGTFPIQSENSAAKLFINDGITGYIVDPWDISNLAKCIEIAIKDDQMVDLAAIENLANLEKKYSYAIGLAQIEELYKS